MSKENIRDVIQQELSNIELPENALGNLPAPIRAFVYKFIGDKNPIEFLSALVPSLPDDKIDSIVEVAKKIAASSDG